MNFELTQEQEMMRESFARFLDDTCTSARLREAEKTGFDREAWSGLADLGAFMLRVPEDRDGLGLGTFDACVLMEEVGRKLPFGPIAETVLAARLLAVLGGEDTADRFGSVVGGETVASLAFHDIANRPKQFIAGGANAELVIARRGNDIVLCSVPEAMRPGEGNLASDGLAEIDLAACDTVVLASGPDAVDLFAGTLEEWKILVAVALAGLGRQALKMAAEYACERKQFGQEIGKFQAISHPLADRLCDIDCGKLLSWKAIRAIADGDNDAAAQVSASLWWNAKAAVETTSQAVQTYGGYGLTTEYDVYLYALRARSWPLVAGDPEQWLTEAGNRQYGNAKPSLPDVGELPIEFDIGEEARSMMAEIDQFMETNVTPEMREQFHYS